MTYPQQQYPPQVPGFPPAPVSAQPQQAPYPPAPQGFAPAPGYPAPPQQYGPPAGYPQQGYPQQFAQPQPAPQLATGSLDAYYSQPSVGGGAALKFNAPNPQIGMPGTTHVGVVARPITNADIQQQTNKSNGLPATYKDGRPKFVMKVPLAVTPSQEHPDGTAQWWCAGMARDELSRAMAEAGAPEGPPEAGSMLEITCTGERQVPGMNPAKTYRVRYMRPNGAQQPTQPAPAVAAPPQFATAAPVQAMPQQVPPMQAAPTAQPVPVAAAPAGANLSAEQQALLAQLTGQAAG